MRRQFLDPVGAGPVEAVVRRLGALAAQSEEALELAVGARRTGSRAGDVARAFHEGRVIRAYAFRGATHLMTPEDGADYLALRAASRMWELPSWRSHYALEPDDWPTFRAVVREALADGPATRGELADALSASTRFRHLAEPVLSGNDTLLKPLTWQGDMAFGPPRGGRATFQRLDANPRWPGIPELDEAGPRAVEAYLRAYGPATDDHVHRWLGEGLGAGRKRIRGWLAGLGDRLAVVDVGGTTAHVLREDLAELAAAPATTAVRLLPGHDQWVLGPGTDDPHLVPPDRRALVTRGAHLVIAGGVLSGTWRLGRDAVTVSWFAEAGPAPQDALADEVERLSALLGRPLALTVDEA